MSGFGNHGDCQTMTTEPSQEVRKLTSRLKRQQRRASLGQLAAHTNHEVKNAIMVIMHCAERLAAALPPAHPDRDAADTIISRCHQVAELMHSAMSLVRKQTDYRAEEVGQYLGAALTVTRPMLRSRQVQLCVQVPTRLPLAVVRGGEIRQVLINLLLNACDALDARTDHHEKRIAVTASLVEGHVPPRICITVEDNGVGIPAEVLPAIFVPGFSTKPGSENGGLGLAISRGIAEAHHGALWAESEPGLYTRLHLEIPAQGAQESRP